MQRLCVYVCTCTYILSTKLLVLLNNLRTVLRHVFIVTSPHLQRSVWDLRFEGWGFYLIQGPGGEGGGWDGSGRELMSVKGKNTRMWPLLGRIDHQCKEKNSRVLFQFSLLKKTWTIMVWGVSETDSRDSAARPSGQLIASAAFLTLDIDYFSQFEKKQRNKQKMKK